MRPMVRFSVRSLPSSLPSAWLLLLGLVCRGHAGDGDFDGHDQLDRLGKRHLHRASHLSAIDAGRHHRAEGADIEEVLAVEVREELRLAVHGFTSM